MEKLKNPHKPRRLKWLLCMAVLLIGFAIFSQRNYQREVTIEILAGQEDETVFQLKPFARRDSEGIGIHTNQIYFYEPGNTAADLNTRLIIETRIDPQPWALNKGLWWDCSCVTDVVDDAGNIVGSYMAATMHLDAANTETLALGRHTLLVRVTTTAGRIIEKSWDFVIKPRNPPRQALPLSLVPHLLYLRVNSQPVPDVVEQVAMETRHFSTTGRDDYIGICMIVAADFTLWIDGEISQDKLMQMPREDGHGFCVDTDYLATGWHFAGIMNDAGSKMLYEWAFEVK